MRFRVDFSRLVTLKNKSARSVIRLYCIRPVAYSFLMGLLTEGEPLSWKETKKLADHVRQHGIDQFINQYHRLKSRSKDCLMWGDEVN